MIRIQVYDKETKKLVWNEDHPNDELANVELEHMKENHFNPDFFDFRKIEVD